MLSLFTRFTRTSFLSTCIRRVFSFSSVVCFEIMCEWLCPSVHAGKRTHTQIGLYLNLSMTVSLWQEGHLCRRHTRSCFLLQRSIWGGSRDTYCKFSPFVSSVGFGESFSSSSASSSFPSSLGLLFEELELVAHSQEEGEVAIFISLSLCLAPVRCILTLTLVMLNLHPHSVHRVLFFPFIPHSTVAPARAVRLRSLCSP